MGLSYCHWGMVSKERVPVCLSADVTSRTCHRREDILDTPFSVIPPFSLDTQEKTYILVDAIVDINRTNISIFEDVIDSEGTPSKF